MGVARGATRTRRTRPPPPDRSLGCPNSQVPATAPPARGAAAGRPGRMARDPCGRRRMPTTDTFTAEEWRTLRFAPLLGVHRPGRPVPGIRPVPPRGVLPCGGTDGRRRNAAASPVEVLGRVALDLDRLSARVRARRPVGGERVVAGLHAARPPAGWTTRTHSAPRSCPGSARGVARSRGRYGRIDQ